MQPMSPLRPLRGGVVLEDEKYRSNKASSRRACLPPTLYLPLRLPYGGLAIPRIQSGTRVKRGTVIAETPPPFSLPVHASSSGILSYTEGLLPFPGTPLGPLACLTPDGLDQAEDPLPPIGPDDPVTVWLERLRVCGITGLGGAGFPSDAKIRALLDQPRLLLINAVECEPYLSCDQRLAEEDAAMLVESAQHLAKGLGIPSIVFALETESHAAQAALMAVNNEGPVPTRLLRVPARYPYGAERQLVAAATGLELSSRSPPATHGILVLNLGTLHALGKALFEGLPLTERLVTVSGSALADGINLWTRIGTPAGHLLSEIGAHPLKEGVLWKMGGSLMGFDIPGPEVPLGKTCGALLIMDPSLRAVPAESPCIRCGDCERVCPSGLQPQRLHAEYKSGRPERLIGLGLSECLECRACDIVCPSHIPLTQSFIEGKSALNSLHFANAQADRARMRFEARQQRLLREANQMKLDSSQRKDALARAAPPNIAAALERARARRGEPGGTSE